MTAQPLRWKCTTCLLDFGEPFCSSCGASLVDSPLFAGLSVLPIEAALVGAATREGDQQ